MAAGFAAPGSEDCIMQQSSHSQADELREITASEVEQVAGAAIDMQAGPFRFYAGLGLISISIDGVGGIDVFTDGQACLMGPKLNDRPSPGVCL
jgi:hypothetical protein